MNASKIINSLISEGKLHKKALKFVNDEALCETFGWTVQELKQCPLFYYRAFSEILSRKSKVQLEKAESSSSVNINS